MESAISIIMRYAVTIAASLNSLWLFYFIFTPLTLYPSYFLLNIFYDAAIEQSTIIINGAMITLVDACIAGSAYFLLTALNFLTPNISLKKRISMLLFEYAAFLAVNLIRIFVLSIMLLYGFPYFATVHLISWHVLSAFFVIAVWIMAIKLFDIEDIPFYSDFRYLKNLTQKK
jgi:hypothetical protein